MKKVSKMAQQMGTAKDKPAITVGLDLGDRYSHYCWLNAEGEVVEEGRIQSTEIAFRRHFEGEPRQRVALEWRDLRFTSDSITLGSDFAGLHGCEPRHIQPRDARHWLTTNVGVAGYFWGFN